MRRWICSVTPFLVLPVAVALTPTCGDAAAVSEQTQVKVKLVQALKSGRERKGEQVRLEVVDDVLGADRSVVIPKGTPVIGSVSRSNGRGMFGKPGKLEFTIDYIKVSEQQRVPLRSTANAARGRNNSAAAITTAVLLAPIAIFVKGREVTVKEGTEYLVYVDQTTEIAPMSVAGAPGAAPKFDKDRLSLIRFKNGEAITGTIHGFKDGVYFIVTETAQMSVNQEAIDSITEKK